VPRNRGSGADHAAWTTRKRLDLQEFYLNTKLLVMKVSSAITGSGMVSFPKFL